MNGTLTDIPGIRVGHVTRADVGTGCTVVLVPPETAAGVIVQGGGPGSRELELLEPTRSVPFVNAILLTGGSAFGLAAADGVVRWLAEHGIGHTTPWAKVPIVPTAVLYDLAVGSSAHHPTSDDGYLACRNAVDDPVRGGTIGAGTGATVGKWAGLEHAMKGGVGSASASLDDGVVAAAMVVANPIGDVWSRNTGRVLAGARREDGSGFRADGEAGFRYRLQRRQEASEMNTTLCVVATNAALNKAELKILAGMAHNGLARAVRPVNTPHDGDLVFALSCGDAVGDMFSLGSAAADLVQSAIEDAVMNATSLHGFPGLAG